MFHLASGVKSVNFGKLLGSEVVLSLYSYCMGGVRSFREVAPIWSQRWPELFKLLGFYSYPGSWCYFGFRNIS